MLELIPLNRYNWEPVAQLRVSEEQTGLIPPNLYSIAQSKFDPTELYGIGLDSETFIGFAAVGRWSDIYWISRLMIDEKYQGLGYGSESLRLILDKLSQRSDAREVRTTVARKNAVAEHLFRKAGFETLPPLPDESEWVMSRILRSY